MVAPLMSHLICTSALIALIVLMPIYYFYIADNVNVDMTERELKEVADYVSNSVENLYILANSTDSEVTLRKDLDLPSAIRKETYLIEITSDEESGSALYVEARLKEQPTISADSWLLPGLNADLESCLIESGEKSVFAEFISNSTGSWVALKRRM